MWAPGAAQMRPRKARKVYASEADIEFSHNYVQKRPHWSTKVTCFWCKNSLSSSTTWFWKIFSLKLIVKDTLTFATSKSGYDHPLNKIRSARHHLVSTRISLKMSLHTKVMTHQSSLAWFQHILYKVCVRKCVLQKGRIKTSNLIMFQEIHLTHT